MELIPVFDCRDLPDEVEMFIIEECDYSCHYDNGVVTVCDDGNPFAEWLKEKGYEFKDKENGDWIALIGS